MIEELLTRYFAPLATAGGGLFWLARLEGAGKATREKVDALEKKLADVKQENAAALSAARNEMATAVAKVGEEQAQLARQIQSQALDLVRIGEMCSGMKLTLDRVYTKMDTFTKSGESN